MADALTDRMWRPLVEPLPADSFRLLLWLVATAGGAVEPCRWWWQVAELGSSSLGTW